MSDSKQLRARLRREAQAINKRNRVPGDLYYKEPQLTEEESQLVIGAIPLQALPNESAPEREKRWSASKPLTNQILRNDLGGSYFIAGIDVITEHYDHFGKIAVFGDDAERVVSRILTDHAHAALVPGLVQVLRELLDCETNLNGCSGVKLLDAVDAARAALEAAGKAGIE